MLVLSGFFSGMEIAFLNKNRLKLEIDRKPTEPFGGTQPNKADGSAEPAEKTVVPVEMKRMTDAMEPRMVEAEE